MQRRWILPTKPDKILIHRLSVELKVSPIIAELLIKRGFTTTNLASLFLDPRLARLEPPEAISGILEASRRLLMAVSGKERITLYGDYDVDGIVSITILYRYLQLAGVQVSCFIPDRFSEGYGLSLPALARCLKETMPSLVVAIDCGTNALLEAEELRKLGCELIVLDHHEPNSETVASLSAALVNPKIGSDFHYLCSAGIVFKLCHAMQKLHPIMGIDLRNFLDLVALGTVADIMPIVEENRVLVKVGLHRLAHSQWVGLRALIQVVGCVAPYTTSDVGFKLCPRINAAGRLGSATKALALLLTDDIHEANKIATELDQTNRQRREIEHEVTIQTEEWIATHFNPLRHASIVVGKRDWNQGVLGIVAARVARRWHRPTLIIGFDNTGFGKGSGRSVDGLSLIDVLRRSSKLLHAFGGHNMAAGLSLQESHLEELRACFESATRELISDDDLVPRLRLDAELDIAFADAEWLDAQDQLAPFGTSNRQPILFSRNVTLCAPPRILKEKHLLLTLKSSCHKRDAIWFNASLHDLPSLPWDIAYTVHKNTWQRRNTVQIQIEAIRQFCSQFE